MQLGDAGGDGSIGRTYDLRPVPMTREPVVMQNRFMKFPFQQERTIFIFSA